jgi:hypothetical protein
LDLPHSQEETAVVYNLQKLGYNREMKKKNITPAKPGQTCRFVRMVTPAASPIYCERKAVLVLDKVPLCKDCFEAEQGKK